MQKVSEQQDKVNYVYINSPDICVACGRPTIPGRQICTTCMNYVKDCGVETIDRQFEEFSEKNYQKLRVKRNRGCGLLDLFRRIGRFSILDL